MSQGQQMKDPSAGVPPQLLPHMHLVSKQKYPQTPNPSLETLVGYLLEGPKIAHDAQPVQWQMLDCPPDGTLLLTWQPPSLGTNFASDGYVWHDSEQIFNSDVRGYNLQMYLYRSGFRPGAEAVAAHSRRRYRLLPTQQNMGAPMGDPNLWLIHYSKAQPQDHIPAAQIPVAPPTQAQLQQRQAIHRSGALARKEFMLRDRASWPTITPPPGFGRQGSAGHGSHRRAQSMEISVEEEEDVSRGDALDFMTPRDISRMRYEQHHEWMEEILESPYGTMAIIPTDLGLGRKGDLEALTKDYFKTPTAAHDESVEGAVGKADRVGKMDPAKAAAFTKLANQKLVDMQAELDKMRLAHQKRMEKLRKTSSLASAEKRLRTAETGQKLGNGVGASPVEDPDAINEIVKEVEGLADRQIERVRNVTCISKGGYQDLSASTASQMDSTPAVAQMSAAVGPSEHQSLLSQPDQAGVHAEQAAQPTAAHQGTTAPGDPPAPAGGVADHSSEVPHENSNDSGDNVDIGADLDIDMSGLDGDDGDLTGPGAAGDDWVMVDDQNLGADTGTEASNGGAETKEGETRTDSADDRREGAEGLRSPNLEPTPNKEVSHDALQSGATPLDPTDFDIDHEFGDVNTAGDALADYGAGDDLNLEGIDDSAFDAFASPGHDNGS